MDPNHGEQINQANGDIGEAAIAPPSPLAGSPLPAESVGSLDSQTLNGSKRRKINLTQSEVWQHLYKEDVTNDDGLVETKARSKYCNELISYDSQGGFYHLKRHTENCVTKIIPMLRKEERRSTPVDPKDWTFDQVVACRSTIVYILRSELPFNYGQNSAFLMFATSLAPQFKPIPTRTVVNVFCKFFREERPILQSLLQSVPGKICLSSNLWTSDEGRGFLFITVHYVDSNWKLNKRLIGFPWLEIDDSSRFEIFEAISNCVMEWKINEKIFSITLDSTVPNDVPERLKEVLLLNDSALRKQLFYIPCGTHILNIMVQEGLKGFHQSLECIRESINHIMCCEETLQKFRELCQDEGVDVKGLAADWPCHWNTTFLMLDAALPCQRIFELFLSGSDFEYVPTVHDWENATFLRDILKVFYVSTKIYSGSKHVSSSAFFHQLSNICLVVSKYEKDPSYGSIIGSMKSKIKEYLGEIPLALGLAACVDPRFKVSFLEVCFEVIYGYEETHRPGGSLEMIRNALKLLFEEYKQKVVQSDPMAYVAEEEDLTYAVYATRKGASSQSNASELQLYLDEPSVGKSDRETLDVLGWWRTQQITYPVLSVMARDLLTIPVSSVPLDSAFTADGQVPNENRKRCPPKLLEISLCLKDWYDAESELQDAKLEEIEDIMKIFDPDSDSDSGSEAGLPSTNGDEVEDLMEDSECEPDSD